VLATGETHTVREIVELAFAETGRAIQWHGSGIEEVGFDAATGKVLVRVDSRYFRLTEVNRLLGNATKAERKFGWRPTISFRELVKEMVQSDVATMLRKA
jgi:GDPmannose 4,6-dehydratase